MSDHPRIVLILTENHTLVPARDLRGLVRMAQIAEDAGIDAVMASDHIVLGPGADADGTMENPRDYALPGNQDPTTPWPDSLVLLSAVAAATQRIRLAASAIIAPLRHPLLLAAQLAALDLLSQGRLVVQPTVSWLRSEYELLGVPFQRRGVILDDHLTAWRVLWRDTPASFQGQFHAFTDAYLEPKPWRHDGPRLWFGGQSLHPRLLDRLVRYGHGFNPLGPATDDDLATLHRALRDAGREPDDLELVGGVRGRFPDAHGVADLGEALAGVPGQLARGFTTICVKPSQFIDDPAHIPAFCSDLVRRFDAMAG